MSNEKEDWLEEFAEMDIQSGTYLPIANGFRYFFTVFFDKKPEKVKKTWKGKESYKFQWSIHYKKLEIENQAYVDVLGSENEEKLKKISNFEKNQDCILELAPTYTKQFSKFAKENKTTNKTIFSMYRTGNSNNTKFHFELVK